MSAHGWMPIETAPMTGEPFESPEGNIYDLGPELLLTDGETVSIGRFEEDDWYLREEGGMEPTHWMPLPQPPVGAA